VGEGERMAKLKISEMSGKLKGIQAINTNPLTNSFCQKMSSCGKKSVICTECYSCAMLKAYRKNCVPAFERNTQSLQVPIADNEVPVFKKNDIVRIHAHGELINETHLENFIKIADKNPTITFSLYTKRIDLINSVFGMKDKPANMILVYSNPVVDAPMEEVPEKFDKVFNVCREKFLGKINCGALSCNTCRKCYKFDGANIIYEKIK
jgi:hypothetical protein